MKRLMDLHVNVKFLLVFFRREYDNLKGSLKSSNEMCEKLKRELISTNSKVHFLCLEMFIQNLISLSLH